MLKLFGPDADEEALTYPGEVLATVAKTLLAQAGIPPQDRERGHQIDRFEIDVNSALIEADGVTYELKAQLVRIPSDE